MKNKIEIRCNFEKIILKKFNMDPEKTKKDSEKSKAESEDKMKEMNSEINSDNTNNSEISEPEKKSKPDWDDREIDFDQLIF